MMSKTLKAVSLHQPWASAIESGAKRWETRSWKTNHRGRILIHAAKHWKPVDINHMLHFKAHSWAAALGHITGDDSEMPGMPERIFREASKLKHFLPFGSLVAMADLVECRPTENMINGTGGLHRETHIMWNGELVSCIEAHLGNYEPGRYAWKLENVQRLPAPIPWPGGQRLFNVPDFEIQNILDERAKQYTEHGYTPEHDDQHTDGSILKAAKCYLLAAQTGMQYFMFPPKDWPWERSAWKCSRYDHENFIKGAALCLAEADRIKRLIARG